MKRLHPIAVAALAVIGGVAVAAAQVADDRYGGKKTDPAAHAEHQDKAKGERTAGGKHSLTATLVDAEKKAQAKAATVDVKVTGVKLTDPAAANEQPRDGQAHLHYKVDDGPVIATTSTKLSFHDLAPGRHKIVVTLAANDHKPLGPQQTLEVNVP